MVNKKHLARVFAKAQRLTTTYGKRLFTAVSTLAMESQPCATHTYAPPKDGYAPIREGDAWGGEWQNLWLHGYFTVPPALQNEPLYLMPRLGGWEGFSYLNGAPHAIFTNKYTIDTHGNHYAARLTEGASGGTTFEIALEYYAGHEIKGCAPFEDSGLKTFQHIYESVKICTKDQLVSDFVFDLRTLVSLTGALPENSFRHGDLLRGLCDVVAVCVEAPNDAPLAQWREGMTQALSIMKPLLAAHNADSAPITAVIGHSHMDTAWLWPVDETIRKCARTYANALNLMDEYPEFLFFQSSSYHSELVRRYYPALFERIRERVAEKRYEPGGAVYIECDCNMTSGESLIRQFLWGQKYTEKHFGMRSNQFWLPDTFGYSAAIPQIMQGCGVSYFFTTKLSWNDTTVFPHDSFWWEGIDGTRVFTHFNATHCAPDPETLLKYTIGAQDFTQEIKDKTVSRRKLIAYGLGDGGGGPEFEMLESVRRVHDLDGCPKTEHRLVGEFAEELAHESQNAPVYTGELYLELHRGTLTNKHQIKRNNRKSEQALHDVEVLTVLSAVQQDMRTDDTLIRPHMETLLKNQFHDILPGSSIERAHEESIAETTALLQEVDALCIRTLSAAPADTLTVFNSLGFAREDTVYLWGTHACGQCITDVFGNVVTALEGLTQPPMSTCVLSANALATAPQEIAASFQYEGNKLETPFYKIKLAENGGFSSLFDKRVGRELCGGLPLNTFVMSEDVPYLWDNWDIDPDTVESCKPCATLLSREVVSCGASQLRLRDTYQLTEQSTLTQDVVFYARDPVIEFHTRMHWSNNHRLLKVCFDTNLRTDFATHEIQFGAMHRPTTRNTAREQAMFEVVNHKYTDLSEPRYGVAVLNDCKYGVSANGGSIWLTLHKAGCRPDPTGDSGVHDCSYAFLPHEGAFAADTVVRAAYRLNNPARIFHGTRALPPAPLTSDCPNIIVETLKPLHERESRAIVVRVYECEGSRTQCRLALAPYITRAVCANMLEEALDTPFAENQEFKPFTIKTYILEY